MAAAGKQGRAPGDAQPPKFTRRVVVDVVHPGGESGTVVMYSTHPAPIRRDPHGAIRFELQVRQFIRDLGCEVRSVEAHPIGAIEDKLNAWKSVYAALQHDGEKLLAANDPRSPDLLDVEL